VRQAMYWGIFSGGFGNTYGCHPVWQMLTPERQAIGLARHNWYDVLDLPGACDLIHARRLMEALPFFSRVPDQSLIVPSYYPETDYVVATRGKGYALVYFPKGWSAEIKLDKIGVDQVKTFWYDPRTGKSSFVENISAKGIRKFTPPSSGRGNDWILVLIDSTEKFTID
ncbi:MAG TPA: putative collagen-binding domain-containing protein, partial [Bacteroidales bacterium]|nr:putative collagen-binding domain-containing protein [Bacteroidales bacterium]